MNRQAKDLEKILAIHISNKGFVSQVIKEKSYNSIIRRQASQFTKMWEMFTRHFIRGDKQWPGST